MTKLQSVVRVVFMVFVATTAVGVVGCGNGSESGSSDEEDTGVITDLPASERCEDACDSFMEECGSLSSASRVQCELGCEGSWSEAVSTCVTEASSCGAIEQCGSVDERDAGGSDADAGEPPIPLPPKDAGGSDADAGDDGGDGDAGSDGADGDGSDLQEPGDAEDG